jgi:hypothetical protein
VRPGPRAGHSAGRLGWVDSAGRLGWSTRLVDPSGEGDTVEAAGANVQFSLRRERSDRIRRKSAPNQTSRRPREPRNPGTSAQNSVINVAVSRPKPTKPPVSGLESLSCSPQRESCAIARRSPIGARSLQWQDVVIGVFAPPILKAARRTEPTDQAPGRSKLLPSLIRAALIFSPGENRKGIPDRTRPRLKAVDLLYVHQMAIARAGTRRSDPKLRLSGTAGQLRHSASDSAPTIRAQETPGTEMGHSPAVEEPNKIRIDRFDIAIDHAGTRTLRLRSILSGTAGHSQDPAAIGSHRRAATATATGDPPPDQATGRKASQPGHCRDVRPPRRPRAR